MKIDIKIKDKKVLQASRSIGVTLCKTLVYIQNVKPFHGVVAAVLHKVTPIVATATIGGSTFQQPAVALL